MLMNLNLQLICSQVLIYLFYLNYIIYAHSTQYINYIFLISIKINFDCKAIL